MKPLHDPPAPAWRRPSARGAGPGALAPARAFSGSAACHRRRSSAKAPFGLFMKPLHYPPAPAWRRPSARGAGPGALAPARAFSGFAACRCLRSPAKAPLGLLMKPLHYPPTPAWRWPSARGAEPMERRRACECALLAVRSGPVALPPSRAFTGFAACRRRRDGSPPSARRPFCPCSSARSTAKPPDRRAPSP